MSSNDDNDDEEVVIIMKRKTAPANARPIKRSADKSIDDAARREMTVDRDSESSFAMKAVYEKASTNQKSDLLAGGSLDYAREVCKDYKETGFCGFGDSCKFIHDRGEHEQVTELNAAWEAFRDKKIHASSSDASPNRTCGICKSSFSDKAATTTILAAIPCNHLFCSTCALSSERSKQRCQVCKTPINGQFKAAK